MFDPKPAVLEGRRVRLEPLDLALHWEGLLAIGLEPELWRWTLAAIDSPVALRDYLETALRERDEGRAVPLATRDLVSGRIAGCTRFGSIERAHRRVEIGWTWVGREFRRSHVNTEAKYLMFRHAFEAWGAVRVELKTNVLNERSRNAMKRIGCVEEGVLRKHAVDPRGTWRDTVYYSVLDDEWPAVKARLEALMARGGGAGPDGADGASAAGAERGERA
uniref:N-acetyltransferase n=1 Tax=Eiseniibacteriota bacterium TaxID=2212470 RepID=A0A832MKP0_UNCEI